MGCSRKHCQECNTLFKLLFGLDYYVLTAAMDKLSGKPSMPNTEVCSQEDEADLRMTIPATTQDLKVVWQEKAIWSKGNRSANYRLSGTMKTRFCDQSELTLDFTHARFNLTGHTITQQSTEAALPPAADDDTNIVGKYETEDNKDVIPPPEKQKKANP